MKIPRAMRSGLASALGFAALAAALPSVADDYRFIISGDPAAAATVGSVSVETPAVALVTGTLTASVASPAFDVRDWTKFATPGVKLNTRPMRGGFLIIH